MKSDAEFRLEIDQLKWAGQLRLRAVLNRHAGRILSSDDSPAKKALTSTFSGDTLNLVKVIPRACARNSNNVRVNN